MRRFKSLCAFVLLVVFLSVQAPALACTVFASVGEDGSVLAGNNEDWLEKDTYVWFLPASSGKLGRVCYGFETAHPQGGMNERGLFFDWFASGSRQAPQPSGMPLYSGDLNDAILEQCATVEDALALYGRYHDPNLGYATLLLADAAGNVATVAWDWQTARMKITRGEPGMAIGVGADRINACLPNLPVTGKDFVFQLLQSSSEMTLYSTVSNLKTGEVSLYNRHQFNQSIRFRLADELKKGPHIWYIPELFPQQARGTRDELNPWKLRGDVNNGVYIGLMAFLALGILALAVLLIRRRKEPQARLLPVTGMAAGAVLLGVLATLNEKMFFVLKYGAALFGFWLPVLMALSAVLFLAFVMTVGVYWVKRRHLRIVRILASAYGVLGLALSLWLTVGYALCK